MRKILRPLTSFIILASAGIMLTAGWIKWRSLEPGHHLVVAWEGLWLPLNFRDAGASFNSCLGQELIRPGLLTRANRWFSGFSCTNVGNPEEIFSLNYKPASREEFFCQGQTGKTIGRHFNRGITLHNLEFLSSWQQEAMGASACNFVHEILKSLARAKRILLHCDAGQDRTGTITALLQALVAERSALPRASWLQAIECDYRQSPYLAPDKYGRQANFINSLPNASVAEFISTTCGIPPETINAAVRQLQTVDPPQ